MQMEADASHDHETGGTILSYSKNSLIGVFLVNEKSKKYKK